MRRVLYIVLLVALLAVPASSAFAQEPQQIPVEETLYLGELLIVLTDGWDPFERVDAYLYRPAAVYPDGWPLTTVAPVAGPTGNMWWWTGDASEQRRWSFAETEGTVFETSDVFGIWGAVLMLPRDEVWYPCSFPLKWKCNYYLGDGTYELHSPQRVNYIGFPLALEYWPWIDVFGAAADPMDTISPLEIDVMNYTVPRYGYQFEAVVDGYDWKWSDIP